MVCRNYPALARVSVGVGVRGTGWYLLEILIKLFWQKPHGDSIDNFVPNNGTKLLLPSQFRTSASFSISSRTGSTDVCVLRVNFKAS